MGVYAWIRESVKQAVLLGFNDAIETIGPPERESKLNEHLAAVLKPRDAADRKTLSSSPAASASPTGRKRLGRSINQIQDAA
jgi:hypothetical protein